MKSYKKGIVLAVALTFVPFLSFAREIYFSQDVQPIPEPFLTEEDIRNQDVREDPLPVTHFLDNSGVVTEDRIEVTEIKVFEADENFEKALRIFDTMDNNKDGVITKEEFLEFNQKIYKNKK